MSLAALKAYCFFCSALAWSARPEASCQSQGSGPKLQGVRTGPRPGQEGPGAPRAVPASEGRPRGLGTGGSPRGRSVLWRCPAAAGLREPTDSQAVILLRAHSGNLGSAGGSQGPGPRVPPPHGPRVPFLSHVSALFCHVSGSGLPRTLFSISKC